MKAIAAVDNKWSIGKNGKLLTSIPADMQFFRQNTMGKVVIMGRKTLESFPRKRPLPQRAENIVITKDPDYQVPGAVVVHSVQEALDEAAKWNPDDVYVIGGGSIYKQMLPYVDECIITKIDCTYDADTQFPNLDEDPEWEHVSESEEETYFDLIYTFNIYRRTKSSW
jgi:dihydrofolate reductase